MDLDALYPVSYASDVSNLKEEPIVEEYLSPSLQKFPMISFHLRVKREDTDITHFPVQNQGAYGLTYL
jgi:hypothetical protein